MPYVIQGINCVAIYTEILFSLVDVGEQVGLIFLVSVTTPILATASLQSSN